MGKHSNVKRFYHSKWEQERSFSGKYLRSSTIKLECSYLVLLITTIQIRWLTQNSTSDEAFCKLCRQVLRPHKADLLRHKKTEKHVSHERTLVNQPAVGEYVYLKFVMY